MARDEDLAALLRDALAHEEAGWQSYEMALESVTQPEVRVELARLARDGQARAALVRRLLRSTAHLSVRLGPASGAGGKCAEFPAGR